MFKPTLALYVSSILLLAGCETPGDGPGGGRPPGRPPSAAGADRSRLSPIFAALDLNHDGVLDSREIALAPKSLMKLDRNGDGKITMEEIRPPGGPDRPQGPSEQPPRGPDGDISR